MYCEILNCKQFDSFCNNDYHYLKIKMVFSGGLDAVDRVSKIAIF
jgi:hypothetical protein